MNFEKMLGTWFVKIILEGEDFKDRCMGKHEIGKAIKKGKYEIFVKLVLSYSYSLDEEIWVIKHVGKRRHKK